MEIGSLGTEWSISGPWHLSPLVEGTNNCVWRADAADGQYAASFVHRMGRYMTGLETEGRMRARVKHSLWREAWLSNNRETLLRHALASA